MLIYATSTFIFSPADYYYYENYYNHTDSQDCGSELPVQHNHETEGTEPNSTEDSETGASIPLKIDTTDVPEGGEEENFIQNSQVVELFGVLPILESAL